MGELLNKLDRAIEECEKSKVKETTLTLTYSELLLLQRFKLTDNYSLELSVKNLRSASKAFETMK